MSAHETATLVVRNNNDSGPNSLRAALTKSQETAGNFNIVFKSDKSPSNELTTGYFTIELQSPLPNIYRNNITINQTNPRSVILVADLAANSRQKTISKMSDDNTGGVNGSMLYVGDTDYLYSAYQHSNLNPPSVVINNVSFIRNKAKGGDGSNGAGGGLGTGGGISLIAGDLTIRNSIFQDLTAVGGSGGAPARGGDGATFADLFKQRDAAPGTTGGKGGLSSIPPRKSVEGELAYDEKLAPRGGAGGGSGTGNSICQGKTSNAYHGGKGGANGENSINFGMGGGGGGGGGGGAWNFNDTFFTCAAVPYITFYRGGYGGRGGNAGYGGGRGGSGGRGASASGKNLFLQGPDPSQPGGGTPGQAGLGKGDAIAILSRTANRNSGVSTRASLNLDQVSFYQSEPKNNLIWSDGGPIDVAVNEVFVGKKRDDRTKVNPGSNDSILINGKTKAYQLTSTAPAFSGISVPRVASVADFSDTVLQGTDLSDRFNVSFENGSTVAGITSDLTNPDNPMNRIWRKIVPDTEKQIMKEYQAKADRSYVETMFTEDRAKEASFNLLEDSIATSLGTVTGLVPGLPGAGAAGMIASDFAQDHLTYVEEQVMMADVRDKALDVNKKNQEDMRAALATDSNVSLAELDLALKRTRVKIKDFELGDDIVTFPAYKGQNVKFNILDGQKISLTYDTGSNKDLPFLEIELTDASKTALRNADNLSDEVALQDMLVKGKNENATMWMLGTRIKKPFEVIGRSASYGPGAVDMYVDRSVNSLPYDDVIEMETSQGSDWIYGSDGSEDILSGRGDDVIFPFFGNDIVNGGPGSDLVSYSGGPKGYPLEPVTLTAVRSNEVKARSLNGSKDGVGVLRNIENFYMYGASDIDLGKLGKPTTNQYNIISGAGGNIKGSSSDDTISISFNPAWNGDTSTGFSKTTKVDGGEGFDTLIINTKEASPQMNVYVKRTGDALQVIRESDEFLLVDARGIEHFDSTTPRGRVSKDSSSIGDGGTVLLGVDNDFGGKARRGIQGSKKNDLLVGSATDNAIYGKKGDDTIEGGFGDDLIFPGKGRNITTGGAGDDRYQLSKKRSTDVVVVESGDEEVLNFNPKSDIIVFANIEELKISDSTSLKKSKRSGSNLVVQPGKNVLMYRNDGQAKFNTVGFEGFDLSEMPSTHLLDSTTLAVIDPTLA